MVPFCDIIEMPADFMYPMLSLEGVKHRISVHEIQNIYIKKILYFCKQINRYLSSHYDMKIMGSSFKLVSSVKNIYF